LIFFKKKYIILYYILLKHVGRASLDKWARRSPRKRRANSGPKWLGWAELGPAHTYSYCSHSTCNQTVAEAIDGRSEVGGNLAKEKELLSLAWSGVGEGAGGRNGGGVVCVWRRKKEEENLQREREDLTVAAPIAGEDLGSWGGLAVVYWWRRKVSVGSSTVEDAVEREREKKCAETGKKTGFLAHFGPDFLLPHAMNSTSIYRQWEREILSTQGKTFQPLIRLGRIPTVGSK
jgi:hypothetical protein